MIHFLYLVGFAMLVSIAFAAFTGGDARRRFFYGVKVFAQFLVISLILGWVFYFLT
jgi:hypothetical protein